MNYSIKEIAKIVQGSFIQQGKEAAIDKLLFDSRKLIDPLQTLFFAIKGKRHDGHLFLEELYRKGVQNFIITEADAAKQETLADANIILVKDTIKALQKLAAFHRKKFNIPVIGITGSNGKTIIKEWLYQLLEEDYNVIRSPKSYNSQIGVPISVWQINETHTLGIFEAGISKPDEMEHLQQIIAPTIGIFTNIGEAHSEGFLNIKHKVKEKLRLFIQSDIIIYCKDYYEITQSFSEIKNQFLDDVNEKEKFKLFTWSKHSDADLRITKIKKRKNETDIFSLYENTVGKITIPFTDDASVENAIHCLATLLYLNIDPAVIEERVQRLGKISMRLELKDGINNCSLINDSYNSDIKSLAIALDFLDQQHQHDKKTVILSDILQSGKNDMQLYQEVKELVEKKNISRLIGIGEAIADKKKFFTSNGGIHCEFFSSTNDFLEHFSEIKFSNESILLKGARKFEFEKISKLLEQKIHKTLLEINLNALVHNLQVYNNLLKPETKIMAMVKALSYGSGSFEIANVLQYHLVDYLTVAYADEGISLRKAGITLPIMVMNPEARSFESMIENRLEPEIYSISILKKFVAVLKSIKDSAASYPVHIKLDTGMHRLGFGENEIPELIAVLGEMRAIKVKSVFSHLSASEEKQHDDFTRQQIEFFKTTCEKISSSLSYPVMRHILNSAGVVRFPEAQFDMIRLGIGLYGVDTTNTIQDQLQQVSTLKSTISQIKKIPAGESVGYGRQFTSDKETTIAIIGIGYADGIDRRLGNGNGTMLVKGQPAPIIGQVCMDMCMLDISRIPKVTEGEEVIIFGEGLPMQEVAQKAGTIPYEILTGVSSRVKRVYFQE